MPVSVTVCGTLQSVGVKISEGPYGPAQVKPDFDACAAAAAAHGLPVRVVIEAALAAYRKAR